MYGFGLLLFTSCAKFKLNNEKFALFSLFLLIVYISLPNKNKSQYITCILLRSHIWNVNIVHIVCCTRSNRKISLYANICFCVFIAAPCGVRVGVCILCVYVCLFTFVVYILFIFSSAKNRFFVSITHKLEETFS